ncbi:MAG: response regulator [Anaerolineaceae bacterium]|nr:response regulator [Anaerolineaceae bacterium]
MDTHSLPTILAVDDEPANLLLLQRLLQREFRVICSPNGQAALAILGQTPIDVVLLDIMMPQMNGYQVLQAIREMPTVADIPVILISAMSDAKDVAQGLEIGANDYITKPIDPDVTTARIQTQVALKQLQDERKKVIQELQSAQTMKDNLLRIASHDLKGPLMNIQLVSSLFRRVEKDIPAAREWLDALESSVETMQTVIEDFLDTAAMNSSVVDINLEPVGVEKVVNNLVTLYHAHAEKKNIKIEVHPYDGCVMGDAARFQQALGNLVSNAVKYSPLHTTIRIWTDREGDTIQINVRDEGPGIPPAERSRLFTQFGKLSTRPTDGEHSTGLGLWIVKHMINLQGGEVGVDCPPEGGSIFWVQMQAA